MTRSAPRPARKPSPKRGEANRASLVFRDFVRQLEKLDTKPPKTAGAGR